MRTASIEYDEFAPLSNTGRYYRYKVTLFNEGHKVGRRAYETQQDAEAFCKYWEGLNDADDWIAMGAPDFG